MATRDELKALLELQQKQMDAQQKQFMDLLNAFTNRPAPNANNSDLFSQINGQIPEFRYDPELDSTFALWFDRFGPFIEKDGQVLAEDMKVRLVLGKLSSTDYIRYEQQVLPKKPTELNFQETISGLKNLFGDTKSVFVRRFECFQLSCAPSQNVLDFGALVNSKCERADMNISKEEIKCLIFISGLGDAHKDLRQECLRQMEKARTATPPKMIKLENLLEECRGIQSLQNSVAALGNPGHVHAIQTRPQRLSDGNTKRFFLKKNQKSFPNKNGITNSNFNEKRQEQKTKCQRCGRQHLLKDCSYPKDVVCFGCGKHGHIKPMCQSIATQSHAVASTFTVVQALQNWIMVPLQINGHQIELAADSCSHLTIIQRPIWLSLGMPILEDKGKVVGSFSGHKLKLLGSFKCSVDFKGVQRSLKCFVADTNAPNIMGLDWIALFEQATEQPIATTLCANQYQLKACAIQPTENHNGLADQIRNSFSQVFQPGLGTCTKTKAVLHLKSNATPIFCRARPVPHGVQEAVDQEIDRLLQMDAIRPVDFSRWAAPVLAVRKKNGAVRICIDFSTGLNDALELNRHPLPRTDDIFHALRGSKVFSQLDFRDAYLQLELDEKSKTLVGINTHRGLFQFQRLPFGIKSAPSIFQKVMDQLTAGMPGVFAYLDDVIIASKDANEHVATVFKLFSRIQSYGFRIQIEKCHFFKKELKFLGHVVSSEGIRPDPERSAAIRDMPPPHDLSTLRSFLGALNYYGRFVKQMRELRSPLDLLLKKDSPWFWGEEQQISFEKAKQVLQSDLVLTQYDPDKPIIVAADASQHGIGATLSHQFPDGSERVVEHACRTLTPAEQNYAQIEREALSLIFAVQKFHRMIYGRKFTLLTDHKPLLAILGSKKGIPIYTASRLQRWALILTNYDFSIKYVKSENFGQADVLSRLIASKRSDEEVVIAHTEAATEYVHLTTLEQLPVDAEEIHVQTAADDLLQQVLSYVRNGWPRKCPNNDLMPFFVRRNTLSVVGGSLLTGTRVVIPSFLRRRVLTTLHFAHPGVVRMKALARKFVYWPGLDHDIEVMVKSCMECQLAAKLPQKAPLRPWPIPEEVFGRIHIDFAGPCQDGNTYLILVDALSKWPEIMQMKSTNAASTIDALNKTFHRYGAPKELVSDNGPPFTSSEFQQFCKLKGIKHTFSPPYQPHCNGQAERMVDTFKRQAKKNSTAKNQNWISEFLFAYRTTPNNVLNGFSPAELFLGRSPRTPLSMLIPRSCNNRQPRQQYQKDMKKQYDRRYGTKHREFLPGNSVLTLNYGKHGKPNWLEGKIVSGKGLIWKVNIPTLGIIVTRHANQLRSFVPYQAGNIYQDDQVQQTVPVNDPNLPVSLDSTPQSPKNVHQSPKDVINPHTPRPIRERRPVDRYSPEPFKTRRHRK